jgi:hypothetical protein
MLTQQPAQSDLRRTARRGPCDSKAHDVCQPGLSFKLHLGCVPYADRDDGFEEDW